MAFSFFTFMYFLYLYNDSKFFKVNINILFMQYFCLFINETHQTGNLKVINFILNVIALFILLTTNTPQCNRYSSNDQIWVENYWINWFITFKFLHFLGLYRHIFIYIYLCLDLFMYISVPLKMDKICCICCVLHFVSL